MQAFSFTDLSLLTGVKAQTFRIWEQRIEFFKSRPKLGRKRLYANDDVKKLLRIAFLYNNGWEILRISLLSDDELEKEAGQVTVGVNNRKTHLAQLLEATIALNEAFFAKAIDDAVAAIGFERTVTDLFHPYLQALDVLGDENKGLPVRKPFATYLLESRLISETECLSERQNSPPEVVLFSPDASPHELPLLFINYLLRKHGWKVLYLGAGTNVEALKEAAKLPGVTTLFVHLTFESPVVPIDDYLAMVRKTFPGKTILVSGKGLDESQRNLVGVVLLKRDEDVLRLIERGRILAQIPFPAAPKKHRLILEARKPLRRRR